MKSTIPILLLLVTLSSPAQTVPSLINFQGRLSDSNGAALPTADYRLTLSIWDTNSGGNLVWGPQIFDGVQGTNGHGLKIPVVQGYFNVILGPTDILNRDLAIAFSGTNRFVEVQVETNAPVSPRQWTAAAPYALNALKLAGADWSTVFGTNDPVNGKIAGTKLANGTITSNQIAPGSITALQLASNGITADRLSLAVTGTNVPVGGVGISGSSGNFTSPSATVPTAISNLNITITTRGNPVEVSFVPDGNTNQNQEAYFGNDGAGGTPIIWVAIVRDGLPVGVAHGYVGVGAYIDLPPGAFKFLDNSAQAGTHTYAAQIYSNSTSALRAYYMRMVVREL